MQNFKILGPNEIGKGILIEYDAGYVSPNEFSNDFILKENINMKSFAKSSENTEFHVPSLSKDVYLTIHCQTGMLQTHVLQLNFCILKHPLDQLIMMNPRLSIMHFTN